MVSQNKQKTTKATDMRQGRTTKTDSMMKKPICTIAGPQAKAIAKALNPEKCLTWVFKRKNGRAVVELWSE